jgi:glycosyltransferase involved in cell wall biosynthesis
MNNNSKVTVLMPVYNSEKYLKEAMESILNQTYQDFEFLIIADPSTDNSIQIIKSYNDSRINLVQNEQKLGLVNSLNLGFEIAQGEYIARMDADDISLPQRLQKQLDFMENNPEIGVCGTLFEMFGTNNQRHDHPENHELIKAFLLFGCYIGHPTVMLRKSILERYDLRYDNSFQHAEDYELWTRVIKYSKFVNIQEVLLHYRSHENQLSSESAHILTQYIRNVQLNYVKNLGFQPTTQEIAIHNAAINGRHKKSLKFKIKAYLWYRKLLKANKNAGFFDQKMLHTVIKRMFSKNYNFMLPFWENLL